VATRRNGDALRHLATLFNVGTAAGLSDGQLLGRFLTREPEAAELAFAALVERHGPMVLRVCRRVPDDPHDAQDAFQATFLVLARRGGSVRRRDSVASWLHGVALRVAGRARRSAALRRAHERRYAGRASEAVPGPCGDAADLGPVLHEEIARLPERYRTPVVLCYLEGQTCEEAAGRLACPVGTVKSRLARARARLRGRLTRRGLGPAGVGALLSAESAGAAVPALLAETTARGAVASGAVPAAVNELVRGVLSAMLRDHLRCAAGALLALGVAVAGARALARPGAEGGAAEAAAVAPPRELSKVTLPAYVVEPPDLIRVEVLEALPGRPIAGELLVRPDGTVTLGYYGDVYVAGLTLKEVKAKVVAHLRGPLGDEQLGLVEPDPKRPGQTRAVAAADSARVRVDVAAYNSKFYYVQGAVASPGRFPVTGGETVLDAINHAGGLSSAGAAGNIRLVRLSLPGGRGERVLPVNLFAIVNAGDPETNYQLMPGDRLVVSCDPKPVPAGGGTGPNPGADVKALERRLEAVERRLERVIELLEEGRAPRPAK